MDTAYCTLCTILFQNWPPVTAFAYCIKDISPITHHRAQLDIHHRPPAETITALVVKEKTNQITAGYTRGTATITRYTAINCTKLETIR